MKSGTQSKTTSEVTLELNSNGNYSPRVQTMHRHSIDMAAAVGGVATGTHSVCCRKAIGAAIGDMTTARCMH